MVSAAASFIPTALPVRHDNGILKPCRSTARGPSRTVCTQVRPRCTLTSEASGGCRRQKRRPRATHPHPIPMHPPRTFKTAFARQAIAHTVWKLPRERPRDRTRRAMPPMQRMAKVKAGMLGVKGGGSAEPVGPPGPKATTTRDPTADQAVPSSPFVGTPCQDIVTPGLRYTSLLARWPQEYNIVQFFVPSRGTLEPFQTYIEPTLAHRPQHDGTSTLFVEQFSGKIKLATPGRPLHKRVLYKLALRPLSTSSFVFKATVTGAAYGALTTVHCVCLAASAVSQTCCSGRPTAAAPALGEPRAWRSQAAWRTTSAA